MPQVLGRAASEDPNPPPLVGLTRKGGGGHTLSFLPALPEGVPHLWQGLQKGSRIPAIRSPALKHPRNGFKHCPATSDGDDKVRQRRRIHSSCQ